MVTLKGLFSQCSIATVARFFQQRGVLLLLCSLAFVLQMNMYLHKDVAIVSHIAEQILKGETYGEGFYDSNPPLIFYLHCVPRLLAHLTGVDIVVMLRMVLVGLILISLLVSQKMIRSLMQEARQAYFMTYSLAFVLLFLPADAFGQREHLLLILTLPYLLFAAYRLEFGSTVPWGWALLIGSIGAVGFAIKPFFLPTWVLIEALFIYKKKSWRAVFRPESISSGCVLLLYAFFVCAFYPAYYREIIPMWLPYYAGVMQSWTAVLMNPSFLWCSAAIGLFWIMRQESSALGQVLMVALLGYVITYLIPRVPWYYHILPALSMAFLYFTFVLSPLCGLFRTSIVERSVFIFLLGTVFFLPVMLSALISVDRVADYHANTPESELMTFFNRSQSKTYLFFSMTHTLYNLEFYSTAKFVGRIPSLGWEYGPSKARAQFTALLAKDLQEKKPDFVITDQDSSDLYLHHHIDFLTEYARYKKFREAWSHYRYFGSLGPYEISIRDTHERGSKQRLFRTAL